MNELIERLSDLEHERWSRWMQYMWAKGTFNPDGSWTMPKAYLEALSRQASTKYSGLTEIEKDGDRREVKRVFAEMRDILDETIRNIQ